MEQAILQKVNRFLELSKKFSKCEEDIFPAKLKQLSKICSSDTISSAFDGGTYRETILDSEAKDNRPLSRAEKMRAEVEIKAKLSDEFDEYQKLQVDLTEYFNALNKLTNK